MNQLNLKAKDLKIESEGTDVEEGCGAEKKAVGKRAKEIMPSTKKEYGKEKGEDIAYAIAQKQVGETTVAGGAAQGGSSGPFVGPLNAEKPIKK